MGAWKPPIPRGALVEARELGPGLVLLGYCYDIIHTDRSLEINLHELCSVLDASYATVRRWWATMRRMGIIERVEERGRGGLHAYLNADWIDWRQPEMRSETSSNMSTNGQEMRSQVSGNEEMRSEMRSETSSNMSTNGSAYKVLMTPDQAESHGGSEDRDGTARTHPPAVALFFEIFPDATISVEQTADLCSISNLAVWREVLVTWRTNGYKPRPGNLLNRYQKDLAKASHHGAHPNGRSPSSRRTEPALGITAGRWRAYKQEHSIGDE